MKIYDVFISYRRSDGLTIAEALYRYLTSKGLRVFFDKIEMPDGHYFWDSIEYAIKTAPHYILVGSTDAFIYRDVDEENDERDYVKDEIELAVIEYDKNKLERTINVVQTAGAIVPKINMLPRSVRNIAKAQWKFLQYGADNSDVFYEIFKSVTNVNRRNLWFAAHRWLENSKQSGGRFASLNINESILPNASKNKTEQKTMPINVYSKGNASENRQSLLDAMGCNSNHLYLIGQGGIGKTTALMHIMNNAYADKQYSENAQIPLFVELSFAPDTYGVLYEGGKSSFIRRSIFKQVRTDRTIKQVTAKEVSDVDEVFSTLPYDIAVQPITNILSKTTPAPEYLLLLDGLNEVSSVTIEETGLSVVQMIMREIDLLISECPNVRVVLTSRSDESAIYNESISRLYLSGVEDSTIKEYLESCKISKELIDEVLEDENLYATLQIPLFLTMYASLSKCYEASTQGEIFKLFFNERRKNISVYTMQSRLAEVEKNVTDVASAVQKNRIDADMQNFILDFVLPEIAWQMERNNEFYLRVREIRKIIEPILTDTDDLSICGEFGRELFSKYRNGSSAKMHTYQVAKRIFKRLGDDITEVTESIINCCVFALGVMQESNGKYGFIHQHIRDYFAALKNINTIRLSVYLYEEDEKELALECMNKAFKDEPVNYTVRRFMGEYLGEHRNKPYYANKKWNYGVPSEKCDRNLLKRTLDIYRGYFDGECGYGISTIISILMDVRGNLSGADFSSLDLKCFCFKYDTVLGQRDLNTNLFGAKLYEYNFIGANYSSNIKSASISTDGQQIAILYTNGNVIVWDVKTKIQIKSMEKNYIDFSDVFYSPDGDMLVIYSKDKTLMFNTQTYALVNSLSKINMISFSKDSKYYCGINKDEILEVFTKSGDSVEKIDCKKTLCCSNKSFYRNLFLDNYIESIYLLERMAILLILKNGNIYRIELKQSKSFELVVKTQMGALNSCISADEQYLSLFVKDKIITYEISTWNEVSSFRLKDIGVSLEDNISLIYSGNDLLIVQKYSGVLKLIDIKQSKEIACKKLNTAVNVQLNLYSDSMIIYNKKDIFVCSAKLLEIRDILKGYYRHGESFSVLPSGIIAFSTSDRMIKFYNVNKKRILEQIENLSEIATHFQCSNDGRFFGVLCKNNKILIWDNLMFNLNPLEIKPLSKVYNFEIYSEFKRVLVACNETVCVFDLENGNDILRISKQKGRVNCAKISPDGKYIATASDGCVKICDNNGNIVKTFANPFVSNIYNKSKHLRAMSIGYISEKIFAVKYVNEDISLFNNDGKKCISTLLHTDYSEQEYKGAYSTSQYLLNSIAGDVDENGSYYFPYDYDNFVSHFGNYMLMLIDDRQKILMFYGKEMSEKTTINCDIGVIRGMSFSEDDKRILIYSKNAICLIDIIDNSSSTVRFDTEYISEVKFLTGGTHIVVLIDNERIEIRDVATLGVVDNLKLQDGHNVLGVDFRRIHKDSELSNQKKLALKQYGAIID